MGINDITAPSPTTAFNDGDLFDTDGTQEFGTSFSAAAPRVINLTMCSSTDGSRFPVVIAENATLEQLQQQLHRTLGLCPSTFMATVGETVLQPGSPADRAGRSQRKRSYATLQVPTSDAGK